MFVSLSITLKAFKFLTLFVAIASTTWREARGASPSLKDKFCPPKPKATIVENSGKYC